MRRRIFAILGLNIILASTLMTAPSAMAADVALGYGFYSGRFEGVYGASYDDKLIVPHGLYDDASNNNSHAAGSKEGFISFINTQLNANSKNSLSARYIVFTMLGIKHTSGGHTKNLTSEQLTDWYGRMRQPNITMKVANYASNINTGYTSRYGGDVFAFSAPINAPSLYFYADGKLVYVIKLDCANPLGDMPGLPATWSASGKSTVSKAVAAPGETVNFSHSIVNTGSTNFANLTWYTAWSTNNSRDAAIDAGQVTLTAGQGSIVSTVPFRLPLRDPPGTQYCQAIYYVPNSTVSWNARSEYACVTSHSGPPFWDVDPASKVTNSGGAAINTAKPGDTIYFTHTLTNVGNKEAKDLQWWQKWGDGSPTNPSNPVRTSTIGAGANIDVVNRQGYRIPDATAPGTRICQTISNIDNEAVGDRQIPLSQKLQTSTPACVTVAADPPRGNDSIYSYYTGGRTPSVPGEQSKWQHGISIANLPASGHGSFDHMDITIWRIIDGRRTSTQISSGNPNSWSNAYLVAEDQINQTHCSYFEYKLYAQRWGWVSVPSGTDSEGRTTYTSVYQYIGSDLARSGSSEGSYGSGTTQCADIGKRPKFQVWGGDLRTRGDVQATWMRPDGDDVAGAPYYGSWVEYGMLASGVVQTSGIKQNIGSGARAAAGTNDLGIWHPLTFANTPSSRGGYTMSSMPTQLEASFKRWADGATTITSVTPGLAKGVYRAPSLSIGNLNLGANQAYVIIVDGDVNITGDILYRNGPYALESLPQLVIVASGNINIAENVGRVDAWLITARGTLNTCNVATPLTTSNCNKQLRINGPVAVGSIIMNRTYGSEVSSSGEPAEIYNYPPDASAWLRAFAADRGRIRSVHTIETPVRY